MNEPAIASQFAQKVYVSNDGYNFNFNEHVWKLSRSRGINWKLLEPHVTSDFLEAFKSVIAKYAISLSADHTRSSYERFKHFCVWESRDGEQVSEVKAQSLANYRASLGTRHEWYVGVLAGLFRRWHDLGYSGLGNGLITMLDGWTISGNVKGEAVQLQSPTQGALTDLEFEALYAAVVAAFEVGKLSLSDFVLMMLSTFSGRRPAQLADLQAKDLIEAQARDGLTEYVLNVPRRKVRGGTFRCEFKVFALNAENGRAVKRLIELNAARLKELDAFEGKISLEELPLFPNWRETERQIGLSAEDRRNQPADVLHLPSQALSTRIIQIARQVEAISERTGEPLEVFPMRLRRTTGTRAAREGHGVLVIAELLDHSDTQNAGVYVENIPEHVDAINKAVALLIAPIAQAFSGKLVETEGAATRGNDPSSRIRTGSGSVMGNCGHFGFCGALAPVACYTCNSFQAWVHGPHQEVLDGLVADNERVSRLTGDPQMTNIMNRTILAVTRVIQLCDERKRELGML